MPAEYAAFAEGDADPNAKLSMRNANVTNGGFGMFLDFPRAGTNSGSETLALAAYNNFSYNGS